MAITNTQNTPPDHILRMTETMGRIDARTASMESQAANDRLENREAHRVLGLRIDVLEGRVVPIEDTLQNNRTTMKNLKIACGGIGSALAVAIAIGGEDIRAFVAHLF